MLQLCSMVAACTHTSINWWTRQMRLASSSRKHSLLPECLTPPITGHFMDKTSSSPPRSALPASLLTQEKWRQAKKTIAKRARESSRAEIALYARPIKQLAKRRMELGLSQYTLSLDLGYSVGMVAKWEALERLPTPFALACWCNALDVELHITEAT